LATTTAPVNDNALEGLGTALLTSGRPAEALDPLRRAARIAYDPRSAYCQLGLALGRLGKADRSSHAP
jgi:Flp pilus assembly protein TadD